MAVQLEHIEAIEILLAKRVNIAIINNDGLTAQSLLLKLKEKEDLRVATKQYDQPMIISKDNFTKISQLFEDHSTLKELSTYCINNSILTFANISLQPLTTDHNIPNNPKMPSLKNILLQKLKLLS